MKMCSKCQCEKDLTEFYYHERRWGSPYSSYCKPCTIAHSKANEAKRRETKSPRLRATKLLIAARGRANCDLTLDWISERIEHGFCEVTGLPFDLEFDHGEAARPYTPSLDRKDPKQGYTKDNTQVVCWIYNRAKGVHKHDDVLTLAKALLNG